MQSALGESLRAEIDITSLTPEESASLQVKVASPETYRAAGVDYNQVLGATSIVLQRRTDGRSFLKITSDRSVQEPFIDVILDLAWSSGRLVREYTLLFDPPSSTRAPTQTVAPTMDSVAPAPAPRPAPAPAPVPAAAAPKPPAPVVEASAPKSRAKPAPVASAASAPAPAPAPAPVPTPAPAPAEPVAERPSAPARSAQGIRVQRGDSLSKIASEHQVAGVSLDQMLVGLYRNNPQAFQGDNMNRLKSGVVLNMPTAEQAKAVTPTEARQVIVAQSADFAAYRQRLAGAVTATAPEKPQRQAAGKVEAEVKDQKQSAAPTPDKLTLSKGGLSSKASAPATEDRLAKARAQKENEARVAELSKNLDDLRKLKEKAATAPAVPVVKPAPAPVPAPAPAPKPAPVASVAAPAVVPPAPAPVPSAPAVVASEASAVAPAASEVASAASEAATSVANAASEAASAASEAMPAPTLPKPVAIPEPEPEAPGLLESLNPMLLAGVGAAVALLAGVAMFLRSRRRADTGETSFLESRLQPDSFFGASGGQRVDTRDATGAPSSMSYSLSQLDAIGDVDPVAEADVYLAYGRDLQAEEILKEALRSTPERLAIRTKLLEVYAKRRDTKGYEQLASQLYNLTGGQGDDWAKAQEMGLGIDPENPLYQPGGQPSSSAPLSVESPLDSLGASTIPHSVMPTPMHLDSPETAPMEEPAGELVDLDLDISAPGPLSEPEFPGEKPSLQFDAFADMPSLDLPAEPPVAAAPAIDEPHTLDFDLPLEPAAPAPAPVASSTGAFDLGDLNLDLDAPAPAPAPAAESLALDDDLSQPSDPMERKFELAEEFRQIGDVDGARELLQEVVANATGALQVKAKSMLDTLS
ncbi:MAG: FimV/HubP family polar landmark protein [Hydrogenophaga sp.]|uniref:FimV/HubP family polar landmark protein n=1 Tax=Hydrogenophaga sp. TaxID=1904254 RepID=UPI002721FA57|nr:FimV/HubP family polar landmark protein [Hydrogenophaga sp.]MDO9031052.1 FimV/HubP family polar landmark protein [Hydrogenophaga sp.]